MYKLNEEEREASFVGSKPEHALHGIIALLYRIGRQMPVITLLWLAIPICSGLLVLPLLTSQKHMIDSVVVKVTGGNGLPDIRSLWLPLSLFLGTMLLQAAAASLRKVTDEVLQHRAAGLIQHEIHMAAASVSLANFEQAAFHDRLHRAQSAAGQDLIGMLRNGVDAIQRLSSFAGMVILVAQAHWILSVILFAINGTAFYYRMKIELAVRRQDKQLTTDGRRSDYWFQQLTDAGTSKELKLFGSAPYLIEQWSRRTLEQRRRRFAMRREENKLGTWITLLHIAGAFGCLAAMMQFMQQGQMTAGLIVIVFQAVFQSQGVMLSLSWPVSKLIMQSGKAKDLVEFLNDQAPIMRPERSANYEAIPGDLKEIRFDNVTFGYPNREHVVLDEVTVSIRAGEAIALVGDNGSGKTTFLKLLLGFYEPSHGSVSWNGVHLSSMDGQLGEIWQRTSSVFQDHERYPFTLRDNVALGDLTRRLDDEEILRLLKACGLEDLIHKSDRGLDTPLGQVVEGGRELSGGQWQRLAIARAMYRQSELVVLDEPTAAIDPASEIEIFEQFHRLRQGKTAIFVSHRLGWARFADRILVLDQGRLIEDGNHKQLLAKGGKYASLFHDQAQWYQESRSI
ncbi:ABC transporter ATP-binding protein [Paenibacillus sp. H1-7]|nr:ABC transporter ATP-binding protein [Paenibacillus sp. H1-7]